MIRFLTALLLGLLVTGAMFWSTMGLVSAPPATDPDVPKAVSVYYLRPKPPPPPSKPPELVCREVREPVAAAPPPVSPPARPRLRPGRFDLPPLARDFALLGVPYPGELLPEPLSAAPRPLTMVKRVPPLYHRRALRRRIEGWVEPALTIGTEGRVASARVPDSKPSGTFDKAALKAVRRWRFQAPDGSGPVQATQKIEFKVKS